MRFNRAQMDEANAKSHDRGFREGRKLARRRFVFGFLFGTIFGVGGLFTYLAYGDQIQDFSKTLFVSICEEVKDSVAKPTSAHADEPSTQP